MQFTIVDGGAAAITLLSGILAYSRGFTREVFAIGGWILAALAAFWFAPMLEPLLPDVPLVGSFLASSCVIRMIVAFTLIVAGALLILAVFTPIFSSMILDSPLAPLDRVLGFVFGVARGVLLLVVAWLIYTNLSGETAEWEPLANSETKKYIVQISDTVMQYLPTEVPAWFGEKIDALMGVCAGELNGAGDAATGAPVAPVAPEAPVAPAN